MLFGWRDFDPPWRHSLPGKPGLEGGSSSTFRIIRIFKITRPHVVLGSDGQLACQRENLDNPIERTLCSTNFTDVEPKICFMGHWVTEWVTEYCSISWTFSNREHDTVSLFGRSVTMMQTWIILTPATRVLAHPPTWAVMSERNW